MADDLNAIIDEHMPALDKPGVLSVRPGFKVKDGWLTDRRSVVVTVRKKLATPPAGEALPTEVAGVPVDVRQASPAKREEIEDPAGWAAQLRLSPDVGSVPHFADERTPAGFRPAAKASAHAQLAKIAKTKLDYSGPAGVTLAAIEAEAKISLSASPDTGWATPYHIKVAVRDHTAVWLSSGNWNNSNQPDIDRQKNGVDVRIIMSEFETAGYLEQLQSLGLDVVNGVKLQNNVHNKGIVIDAQAVLVSSQNWSTDGTLYNRDAGVIIYDASAAQYFQQIFLHDWEHLAEQQARSD